MTQNTINEKRELLSQLGFTSNFLNALERYTPDMVEFQQQESIELMLQNPETFSPDLTLFTPEDYASTDIYLKVG